MTWRGPELAGNLEARAQGPLPHLSMGIHGDDWRRFFEGTGIMPPAPSSSRRFRSLIVDLPAGLNGDGVKLGWETLLQDQFDLGQLVPVAARRVPTERGYCACLMKRAGNAPAAIGFPEWEPATGSDRGAGA